MDAKPVFNGLLGVLRFGELLPLVLFTVKPEAKYEVILTKR